MNSTVAFHSEIILSFLFELVGLDRNVIPFFQISIMRESHNELRPPVCAQNLGNLSVRGCLEEEITRMRRFVCLREEAIE